jgi:hypothetical protein
MTYAGEQSERGADRRGRGKLLGRPAAVGGAAAFAVVLWGGYGLHWSWTGINGTTATLWDWLHLLLLPIAVAILPLWLSRRARLPRRHKEIGLCVLSAFAVLVLAGYLIPWGWTGFVGNRLWDWLELLVLPLAVALSPLLLEWRDSWTRRYSLVALTAAAAFAVVVVGGYVGDWSWTGFGGNTLWNRLHLWLLPLLIPVVVVPALRPRAMSGVILREDEDQPHDSMDET